MLTAEQVQRIMGLTQAKHMAALALATAQETFDRTCADIDEYLAGLQEPQAPQRKRRSDAGVSRAARLIGNGASVAGLPDENQVGN